MYRVFFYPSWNNKTNDLLAWKAMPLPDIFFAKIRNLPKYISACKRINSIPSWKMWINCYNIAFKCEVQNLIFWCKMHDLMEKCIPFCYSLVMDSLLNKITVCIVRNKMLNRILEESSQFDFLNQDCLTFGKITASTYTSLLIIDMTR